MNMSSKQDRQGARTVTDLERRYNFGKTFAEVIGIATDAQEAANTAASGIDGLDEKLDQDEIFNRLTNNGQLQGIYRGEDGEIYINASYIVSGELLANIIKSGVIKSVDGESVVIDLDNGFAKLNGTIRTQEETVEGDITAFSRVMPSSIDVVAQEKNPVTGVSNPIASVVVGVDGSRGFVTGLSSPVFGDDAVNKDYVDALEERVKALEIALGIS